MTYTIDFVNLQQNHALTSLAITLELASLIQLCRLPKNTGQNPWNIAL